MLSPAHIISFTICATILLIGLQPALAQQDRTADLPILHTGPSAHSLSIAEAHTAVSLGPASIFTNPAHLTLMEESTVDLTYTRWILDTHNNYAGYTHRSGSSGYGAAFISSSTGAGALPLLTDEPDAPLQHYLLTAASFSRRFGVFSAGLTGMYIHEQLRGQLASGAGVTLGGSVQLMDGRMRLAASINNLGTMQDLNGSSRRLPGALKLGTRAQLLQFSVEQDDSIPVLISGSLDYRQPLVETAGLSGEVDPVRSGGFRPDDPSFNMALDARIAELIMLRGGYKTSRHVNRFGLGGGLQYENLDINYAFLPFVDGLGFGHSIGVQYRL